MEILHLNLHREWFAAIVANQAHGIPPPHTVLESPLRKSEI